MSKEPLVMLLDRQLTAEELELPKESKAPNIKRLSTRHHRLARLLAEGFAPGEAGLACNIVASRVSILQDDPTFRELVTFYRKNVDAQYLDLHNRLAGIAVDAAEILSDRLETDPDQFENIELAKLVALGADRTGHGPSSTHNHNHFNGLADRLDAARQRIRAAIIDAEVVDEQD